jgi:ABC-type multidrug transport system fused ATPase/permease subunit
MSSLPPLASRDRVFDAVLVVICGVGQAAAAAFAAFATRDAFEALHAGNGIESRTLVELGAAGLVAALCLYLARRRSEALGQSYANALRQSLYRQVAALPKGRHQERRVGALSLRFVGDLSAARLWFGSGLPDTLTALVVLPGAMAILFALDPVLAPVGIGPIVISLLLMTGMAWHLEQRHSTLRSRRAGLAITMIERIAMSPELDLMGRTGKEMRALAERGETLRKDAVARRSRTASLQAILRAGTSIAGLAVLWSAGQTGVAPGTVAASLAVLALLVLPLQNLATAWDRYCGWRVARGKALNLFSEKIVKRRTDSRKQAVEVRICGQIAGQPVEQTFTKGGISNLDDDHAVQIARHIAGLDRSASLTVTFEGADAQPKTAFIGDGYVGLQGSLRRSVTLLCRKRPTDQKIKETLNAYGIGYLLERDRGLDTRIAESGRNLSAEETLRLDLARAELGKVYLLVVASIRWHAMSDGHCLLELYRNRSGATVIVTSPVPNLQKRVA